MKSVTTLLELGGIGLIVAGVAWFSVPVALIVAGVAALVLSWRLSGGES